MCSTIAKKLRRKLGRYASIKKMVCFLLMGSHNNLTFLWCSECEIKSEHDISRQSCEVILAEYAKRKNLRTSKYQPKNSTYEASEKGKLKQKPSRSS
mmetsp:Transcript_35700/g.44291  ORF Transcript_35700/g.44291 Transcript_35700/m.44291 type:complete len:97 (+) Transcript_35700:233-523(+)